MSILQKAIFTVSEKGNPMAQIWVDEADVTKNSESIYIALKSQVAYLFFLGKGATINLKKSKQFYNVEVPDLFTNLFDNYKVSQDNTVKMIGAMLNQAFDNAFNSLEFLKSGEVVKISQAEADEKCKEFMCGYVSLYDTALKSLSESKIKALKSIANILNKEDSKPAEVKEANNIVMQYATLLSRNIDKQKFVIEKEQ